MFPLIAMDRSGSHVAETALKALAVHLQDDDMYAVIEETLTKICQVYLIYLYYVHFPFRDFTKCMSTIARKLVATHDTQMLIR